MRIIDGDTVKLGGTTYRLAGIDAPENGQAATDARGRRFDAGAAATDALSHCLTDMQARDWQVDIVCHPGDLDRYRRQLARIELTHPDGRTLDACAWMVAEGWAVAEYGAQYRALENDARRHRRGLWAGEFERPKDWRRARRGQSAPATAAAPATAGWLWALRFVLEVLLAIITGASLILLAILMGASRQRTRYRRRRRALW